MKSLMLALIAITITLCAAACSNSKTATNGNTKSSTASSVAATPDEFAATRATFAKHCAVCHGDAGEGKTATIEGKRIKAPSLRSGHALHHPDSDFVKQISKGGDGMPPFKEKLSPKEIDDMVRFIRREFQGGQAPQAMPSMKM